MLQRTSGLGGVIMMLSFMVSEVMKFFSVFGLLLSIFMIIGTMLVYQVKINPEYSYWLTFIDMYRTLNGDEVLEEYTVPSG